MHPSFQQTLPFTDAYQFLQQCTDLEGLVFLQDHQQPIIAFLPEDYWLIQKNTAYYYQRKNNFDYICQQQYAIEDAHQHITHWQKIEENQQYLQGFTGGYIGFISYDAGANFHLKSKIKTKNQPNLYIGCYRSYIQITENQFIFHSSDIHAEKIYQYLLTHIQKNKLPNSLKLKYQIQSRWNKSDYHTAFNKVQDYIRAGDCYQINLTQEFTTQADGDLLSIAPLLWQHTQAPFSGYFKRGEFELLSCSPELFIEWQTAQQIKTRPIKGTMPRHETPEQDEYYRQQLKLSEKDQAENIMIVDLLRNDLSLYAELGSVKTTKLFEIESFKQVHHLVSEIQATLKPIHPYQVLMMALPGGSITGAPKIRAMEIIDELEQNARGIYCGSLGYFNFNGTGRWNILIRTVQKYQQHLSLWAGGGITIASQVDAEYQECFDKIQKIIQLINQSVSNE